MDDKVYEMIMARLDRIEKKVDSTIEFQHTWKGKIMGALFVLPIIGAFAINYISKKLWG